VDDVARGRVRVRLGGVVVLVLAAVACAVLVAALTRPGGAREPEVTTAPSQVPARDLRIAVHVLGAVERPGFYELRDGARVLDALAAAGGLTESADPAGVNLARFVTDGEQIRVPAVGETPVTAPGLTVDGLVNLNTADAAVLETLPRVGPAMAARIIAWREANGGFGAVDDLRSVTGIGERTFAELQPLVTV
jgi:competence protein ComEA